MATIVTQAITLAAGILTRRFLGPTQMGIWSLLQIIVIYSNYASLGVTEAILREIPFYEGKGDKAKVHEIKDQVFSFSLLTALVIAVGVAIYAMIFSRSLGQPVFYGLLFVAAIVILQRINNLYISFLRGFKHFDLAAKQMIYSSIVNGFLVAILSFKYQMYGFMWALILSFIFNIGYILIYVRFGFKWIIHWRRIGSLIHYGFPLLVLSLLDQIFLSIDKIMIAKMLGVTQLGLYSVALMSYGFLGKVPSAVGIVLVPNLHQKYGERENLEDLRGYLKKSAAAFSELMPCLIGLGWLWISYLARFVLPDYMGSIAPMQSLILSAYFLALFHPFSYLITVMRKQILLLPIILSACIIAVTCNFLVMKAGWGITGVGVVTTFVFAIKFTIVYFTSTPHIMKKGERYKLYATLMLKFAFLLAVLWGLRHFLPNAELSPLKTTFASLIFILIYIPFWIKLLKDLGYLEKLRKRFWVTPKPEDDTDHE